MTTLKVIGAGSIGNHLSNAARAKGWDVTLCDIDPDALERTRRQIYPGRYGKWDEAIRLVTAKDAPRGEFDWIFIGTPPNSHIELALEAIEERPKAILVEKPCATPDLAGCQTLHEKAAKASVHVFVGYDHVVAKSTTHFVTLARSAKDVKTLDVSFREHWQGIFNAHPWLAGPADSYLGYWQRGGGACGEHSHALNLWQHIAHEIGAGRVTGVAATLDYVVQDGAEYDRLALLNLRTETGFVGRVAQDVVTRPAMKQARLQASNEALEWKCEPSPYRDIVNRYAEKNDEQVFAKTRPDDFIQELTHLESAVKNGGRSPISLDRGLDSMMVIAAAHMSAQRRCEITIDYSKGYNRGALAPAQK